MEQYGNTEPPKKLDKTEKLPPPCPHMQPYKGRPSLSAPGSHRSGTPQTLKSMAFLGGGKSLETLLNLTEAASVHMYPLWASERLLEF